MKIQKPIPGGRKKLGASVLKQIRRKVESIAHQNNVSMSFVINVILAEKFNIEQEQYDNQRETRTTRPASRGNSTSYSHHAEIALLRQQRLRKSQEVH